MKNSILKKVLAVILIIGLFCPVTSMASDTNRPEPNKVLLEAMLNGDRKWVIDTLVNDNRSTNPVAILHGRDHEKSLAKDNIDRFNGIDVENETEAAVYKAFIQIMEKYYNAEEYIDSLFNELGECVAWAVGLFSSKDSAHQMADRLTAGKDELTYDRLLKGVFTASYTASNGTKLADTEGSLTMLRQIKDGLDYFTAFTSYVNANIDTVISSGNRAAFDSVYMDDYALAYCDAAEGYFSALGDSVSGNYAKSAAEMVAYLSTIERMVVYAPQDSFLGYSYVDSLADDLVDHEIDAMLKAAGKPLTYASTAVDTYLYLNSIQQQRDTIGGPISRMAALESDKSLKKSLLNFQILMNEQYNSNLLSWDSISAYLRDNSTVTKYISKNALSFVRKHLHLTNDYLLGETVGKEVAVVSISTWIADQVTGLEDTCKKTYELRYWKSLTDLCVKTYKSDLATYQSNPTDDNAAIVLDDLLLLQRLRLYGEKTVYEMMKSQSDSWIGKLYGEGTAEAWKTLFQYSVDELMAATIAPSVNGITVDSGEILTIGYQSNVGYYARKSVSGNQIYYVDLPTQLSGGLTLYGTLIVDNPNTTPLSVGFIEVGNSSSPLLGVYSGSLRIGELYQSGSNMQLSILENADLTIGGTAKFQNVSILKGSDKFLSVRDLELNGSFGGSISATGDISGNSGSASALKVCGSNPTISGTIAVGNLTYAHSGTLTQTGTVNVTGALKSNEKKLKGGENTVLKNTGWIVGNTYPHPLTVDGAQIHDVSFADSLYVEGASGLADVSVKKLLHQSSGTLTLIGDLNAQSDVYFGGTVRQTSGTVTALGNISGNDSSVSLNRLKLCGTLPQTVNTPITVVDFINENTIGMTLSDTVTVTGKAQSLKAPVDGSNVTMTNTASFADGIYYGDVTLKNLKLHGTVPSNVHGTVYITGDLEQQSDIAAKEFVIGSGVLSVKDRDVTLKGACRMQGGKISLSNAALTFDGAFVSSSGTTVTADADSTVSFCDANIGGTLTVDGECHIFGDLTNNDGTINVNSLRFEPTFPASVGGEPIHAEYLTICGKSRVTLNTKLYISRDWTANDKVVKAENIIYTGNEDISADETYDTMFTVEGDFIVDGRTVTASKGLTVKNGSIILRNGGRLNVKELTLTGGNIELSGGSSLTVNGLTTITGTSGNRIVIDEESELTLKKLSILKTLNSIEVNGSLRFGSDAALTSVILQGDGTISIAGDLIGSSLTVDKPANFIFCGKLTQTVNAGGADFLNLTISNTSRDGVTFSSAVNCYGVYETGGNSVSGTVNMIEQ